MKFKTDEIQKIGKQFRPNINSFLNFNPINPKISDGLSSKGIQNTLIKGTISKYRSHIGGDEHMYIQIDSKYISNVQSNKPIIIDGALKQFCIQNYEQGKVSVNIGSKEDIPLVAVIKPNNKLYNMYVYFIIHNHVKSNGFVDTREYESL